MDPVVVPTVELVGILIGARIREVERHKVELDIALVVAQRNLIGLVKWSGEFYRPRRLHTFIEEFEIDQGDFRRFGVLVEFVREEAVQAARAAKEEFTLISSVIRHAVEFETLQPNLEPVVSKCLRIRIET